jgi:hypothetical protein
MNMYKLKLLIHIQVNILIMCPIGKTFSQDMFFTIYQHSRHFNLETLLMLRIFSGIFGKKPPS